MGFGLCLRGISAGVWVSLLEMPLDSSSEWRTIDFKSVWVYQLLEKNSMGSIPAPLEDAKLTPVLEDSGRTQLGKLEPALSCSWGWWPGGLMGTRGRVSTTLSHLPDWRPEVTWCKIRHDLPSPCPFSSRPIHSPLVPQGRRICRLRQVESLASSFYPISTLRFLSNYCVS